MVYPCLHAGKAGLSRQHRSSVPIGPSPWIIGRDPAAGNSLNRFGRLVLYVGRRDKRRNENVHILRLAFLVAARNGAPPLGVRSGLGLGVNPMGVIVVPWCQHARMICMFV